MLTCPLSGRMTRTGQSLSIRFVGIYTVYCWKLEESTCSSGHGNNLPARRFAGMGWHYDGWECAVESDR